MGLPTHQLNTITHSLKEDFELLNCHFPPNLKDRLLLIATKYYLITKHLYLHTPIKLGKAKIKIGGSWFFYESALGIAPFQSMIVEFEKQHLKHLKDLKRPLVIDVGAHIGFFSIAAAQLLNSPKIYACEPLTLTFDLLKKNCKTFKSITPINLGFSSIRSKVPIHYVKNKLVYSSLHPQRFLWTNNFKTQLVKLETLDTFIATKNIKKIDILKIDAEGAEEQILKGAQKTLAKTQFLILECALDNLNCSTFSSTIAKLKGKGFNFQLLNAQPQLPDPDGKPALINMLLENLSLRKKENTK